MKKKVYLIELIIGCNVLQSEILKVDGRLPGCATTEEDMENMRVAAEVLMKGVKLYLKQEAD